MKLQIKHLAPYLPYGLKVKNGNDVFTVNALSLECVFFKGGLLNIFDVKPILRPLSDLSKLGMYNIPINEHTINLMIEEKFNEVLEFEHYEGSIDLIKEGDSSQGYDSGKAISFEVFEEIRNELLKGHYDIFGLIDKGLAIDMNLINNE